MEPFLKAVGGKRWLSTTLAREIMRYNPTRYVELFAGGGAVALVLPPSLRKLVNDANPAFAAVWQAIITQKPEDLLTALAAVYRAYPDTAFGYAQARDELNTHLDQPVGAPRLPATMLRFAALTLYINARCFNGLWRVNGRGGFNVPWGKRKQARRFTLAELRTYQEALRCTEVRGDDFRQVCASLVALPRAERSRITIFADPPYEGMYADYTAEGFDETDQRDLAHWLKYLVDLGMRVWATNADTPLIREIYAWAQIETVVEHHIVGPKSAQRGDRGCLLIRGGL